MIPNNDFLVGGLAARSSVAHQESRGPDGFSPRKKRLKDKNDPKHAANSEPFSETLRTPARKRSLKTLQMQSNKKTKTARSRHRKTRTVHRKSKLVQSTGKKSRRWYGHSHHVSKFVPVPVPEECAPVPLPSTEKIKITPQQIIEPESEDDDYNSKSLKSTVRPSRSSSSSKLAKFNVKNISAENEPLPSNTNIPVPTPIKKEFRLPSSNWEPDSDDEDTSKPVVELPEGPRPFKLAFTNWIGEKQYEWYIHSKLMSLTPGTIVKVCNILHPDFWRGDINSSTDYEVPFDPVDFLHSIK